MLSVNALCYEAIFRIYRNAIVRYVQRRLKDEFPFDYQGQVRVIMSKDLWEELIQNYERSRAGGGGAAIEDHIDLLGVNNFQTLFQRFDFLAPGDSKEARSATKKAILRDVQAIKVGRDPLAHPPFADITLEQASDLTAAARRVTERFDQAAADELKAIERQFFLARLTDTTARENVRLSASDPDLKGAFAPYLEALRKSLENPSQRWVDLQAELIRVPPMETSEFEGAIDSTDCPLGPLPLSDLVASVHQFVLTGRAGAGKTTTLASFAMMLARRSGRSDSLQRIPVRVKAYQLATSSSLSELLPALIPEVDRTCLDLALHSNRLLLLVDALNEVSVDDRTRVVDRLRSFIDTHPRTGLVVATRSNDYCDELSVPTYDIRPLDDRQIRELLAKNCHDPGAGQRLFTRIAHQNRLNGLFRAPLMAWLLCSLPSGVRIPHSLGEMLPIFFSEIFGREMRKGSRLQRTLADETLAQCAVALDASSGQVLAERELVRSVSQAVRSYTTTPPLEIITQLVDSGILVRQADAMPTQRGGGEIRFFHEAALDFYLAVAWRNVWDEAMGTTERGLPRKPSAVEFLATLVDTPETLIDQVMTFDIALAARCYSSRSQRPEGMRGRIISACEALIATGSREAEVGIRALASLDELEATELLFDSLVGLPTGLIKSAQDALVAMDPEGADELAISRLREGKAVEREVALEYVGAVKLRSADSLVIRVAEELDPLLARTVGRVLGSLGTAAAVGYLTEQAGLPPGERAIPLDGAVTAMDLESSSLTVKFCQSLLHDGDVVARRAAVMRLSSSRLLTAEQLRDLVSLDDDLQLRLVGLASLVETDGLEDIRSYLPQAFAVPYPAELRPPVRELHRLVDLLPEGLLPTMLLEALCSKNPGIQGVVAQRVLKRDPSLGPSFMALIDISDRSISSGAKARLVEAAASAGSMSLDSMRGILAGDFPTSVRIAAATALINSDSPADWLLNTLALDSHPAVRTLVGSLLSSRPDTVSVASFLSLVEHGDSAVKKAAIKALLRVAESGSHRVVVSKVLERLSLSANPEVRGLGVTLFERDPSAATVTYLASLINDVSPDIRRSAHRVLFHARKFGTHKEVISAAAVELSRSDDVVRARQGRRILSSLFPQDMLGVITTWSGALGSGSIRPIVRGSPIFFSQVDVTGDFVPREGDLVAYFPTRLTGAQSGLGGVRLLCRGESASEASSRGRIV